MAIGICKVFYALDSIYKWYCIAGKVVVVVAPVTTTVVAVTASVFDAVFAPPDYVFYPSLLLWQLPSLLVVAELLEHVLRVPKTENQVGDGDVSVGHLDRKKVNLI